jgi:hypothetical protein
MRAPRNWPNAYLQRFATSVTGDIYKAPVIAYILPSDIAVGAISEPKPHQTKPSSTDS